MKIVNLIWSSSPSPAAASKNRKHQHSAAFFFHLHRIECLKFCPSFLCPPRSLVDKIKAASIWRSWWEMFNWPLTINIFITLFHFTLWTLHTPRQRAEPLFCGGIYQPQRENDMLANPRECTSSNATKIPLKIKQMHLFLYYLNVDCVSVRTPNTKVDLCSQRKLL